MPIHTSHECRKTNHCTELFEAYKAEKSAGAVRRMMLVILVERDGMSRTEAAEYLGMARSWGVKWYGRYLREGLSGLRTRPRSGRPPFVSKKIIKKIRRIAKKTTCWTASGMRDLIAGMSGVEYEISYVRQLLRRWGYTMKVPVARHVKRASRRRIAGFQRRLRRIIPEKTTEGRTKCVQDETIVIADARSHKGVYTLKGERAVYTYTGTHAKTIVFGLITDDGEGMFERYDRFTKDEFADFLIKAYRRFGMLLMILDRAPQHKAALVHETLAGLNGMIELEYLPPGCPELNAVEEIWRQMKHAVLDVTYLTVGGMYERIDRWLSSSMPALDIEKYLYRIV